MKRMVVAFAAVLVLAGCSSSSSGSEAEPVVPSVEEATESQVASVIAKYEADWRETGEAAGNCRFTWVMDSQDDPIANMEGLTCYLNEQTASVTAGLAIQDLQALTLPPSMTDIVGQTIRALQPVADTDLKAVCGDGNWPSNTDECNSALASNFAAFNALSSTLDSWKPYF